MDSSGAEARGDAARGQPEARDSLAGYLSEKRTDLLLFFTRLLTLVFAVHALFFASAVSHQRSLLAAAATSALRLHQRMPAVRFDRQFWALISGEDAFHYLLYCVAFGLSRPLSLALLPVSLFAFLHSASFALLLADKSRNSGKSPSIALNFPV